MINWERYTTNFIRTSTNMLAEQKKLTIPSSMHWHDFYEIEIILSGEGKCILNGVEKQMSRGSVFFLTPVDFHSVEVIKPIGLYNIMFAENWIDDEIYGGILDLRAGYAMLNNNETFERLVSFCALLIEEQRSVQLLFSESYAFVVLKCILIEMLRLLCGGQTQQLDVKPVRRAMNYIQLYSKEQITLESVSKFVNLSSTYLSALFHECVGSTFKEYLTQVRIKHACVLLRYSDLPIIQVCFQSGFNSMSNFFRAFKKSMGTAPYRYREDSRK